ncbi:hypothetical protein [Aquamicrobium sp.]|uniref:hypothetical protein n=1 Tax=Aquamicrobium sp. TaxID=1872579 RepID=UPI00258B8C2D|nr:hypothetical protein [Aquamicrobium sp.]MCK9550444.1 hypothetical protein [Aquamicrobium sp.]
MNTSDVERTLFNFLDQNRLLNLGLEYYIAENADELKQEYKINIDNKDFLGGFLPNENTVILIADRIIDTSEVIAVASHEIFGHAMINFLSRNEKAKLLIEIGNEFKKPNSPIKNEIKVLQNTPGYKNISQYHQAEEIFCFVAEKVKINLFVKYDENYKNTVNNLDGIIQNIAAGVRGNKLEQQIFPKNVNDLGVEKEIVDIQKSQDKGLSR